MHRLLKNGLYITAFTVAALPLSYLVRLLLTQNLTLEEFGLFYAMIGFFGLLQSFNDLGFSETQLYFIPKFITQGREDKLKATIKTQLINQVVTTLTISCFLLASAQWFSTTVFHSPESTQLFRIFVLYFIIKDFLQNIQVLIFSYQEVEIHGSVEPVRFVLTTILFMLALSLYKFDLLTVIWIWLAVHAILAIGYGLLFFIRHRYLLKAAYYSPLKIYKEFIPFLIPTLLSNNLATVFTRGAETLLAYFKGVTEVGLYNIARPISNLALALTAPVAELLKPYVVQVSEQKDTTSVHTLIQIILNAGVFLLLPFSLILSFYSKESITFLFGAEYTQATLILRFISFEIFFTIMNSFVFGIVFGLGLQQARAKIIYLSSTASLVLSLLLIPPFGAVGLAVTSLISAIFAMVGGIYIIHQKIPFTLPVKNYFIITFLSLLLLVSQVVFKHFSPQTLSYQFIAFVAKVVVGMLLYYSVGIFVFKVIDASVVYKLLPSLIPRSVLRLLSIGKYK